MKILLATSELSPLVKTGGLADMVSALAGALEKEGCDVSIALPYYSKINVDTEVIDTVSVDVGDETVTGKIHKTILPHTSIPIYLISQEGYFHRNGIYNDHGVEYKDNIQRYTFFCRAVMELIHKDIVQPDIIHANDWQTGLLPVYLQTEFSHETQFKNIRSMFTIHNLAYQGSFPSEMFPVTGVGWEHFHMEALEFYNHVNLLKGGIVFSDLITTVSPTYAQEIQTPEFGCGLEGVLQNRNDVLSGVLNGVDYSVWSPDTDELISHPYTTENATKQKPLNKKTLQTMFELPATTADKPLFGVVSRLAEQKGLDLLADIAPKLFELDAQIIVLGSGDPALESRYEALQKQFPTHCGVKIAYNEKIAHQIEAGADLFLMPSRYEPCGLNQMYSLRYGTIPVVHNTGGLADTIIDVEVNPNGNGFSFSEATADELLTACKRAMAYYQQKEFWNALVRRAMEQDYSWNYSAKQYILNYEQIAATHAAVY